MIYKTDELFMDENNYNNYSGKAEIRHFFLIAGYVVDLGENVKFKPTFLTKPADLISPMTGVATHNSAM